MDTDSAHERIYGRLRAPATPRAWARTTLWLGWQVWAPPSLTIHRNTADAHAHACAHLSAAVCACVRLRFHVANTAVVRSTFTPHRQDTD